MSVPLLALVAALLPAAPTSAQEVVQAATPNADRLAEEMRVLARDPRNVRALLSAGELSARLSDPSAAAGFFARAQALDPRNPRLQAGQAMVMVRNERPGEALRLFDAAARAGLAMEPYASDRGLAYDLIGAQGHAQREHRVAMRLNPDDETRRRYALSLGISGDTAQAMTILDPLLKRSDRAAWRARAFILAMNGDAAGADKIAASMMGGFGTALSPFFRRLPALAAADKAFAVHFGEIRRTPARIADASVAPPLPALRPEPGVALAAAQQTRVPQPAASQPARQERRMNASQRRQAAREAQAQQVREAEARETQRLAQQEADRREAQRLADIRAQQEREALAARQRESERLASEQAAREAEARRVAELQAQQRAAAEAVRLAEAQRAAEAQRLAAAPVATPPPVDPVVQAQPAQVAEAASSTPAVSQPAAPAAQVAAAMPPQPPGIGKEDSVIARIIAGITIPASELGVAPMPGEQRAEAAAPEPTPQPDPAPAAAAPVQVTRVQPTRPEPARAAGGSKEVESKARPAAKAGDAAAAKPTPANAKGKAAEAKGKAADPKAKAKPDPAKAEPARIWVQVAGGANVSDLPKAWRGLVAKAPAEFRGRQPWTTPLRFTNRLLTGPFKTAGEAQGFVNAIGRKGLSAFTFTSEAGQKIDKLSAN
ncbi:hypothetical protein [Sphingomonas turrisvirgatae]|uniref:Uncharacterized protein n=1 Tax=Sphingomonas turrisvirgatae TaxID=1888892 RepID=A0A1E3LSA4_9SPHN|nr:hypothetical protein [Sphingomonas turrisvirgatae]ODP36631.1 hypothetical protein BFL28_04785 [Sphingomonas turrisvirgatae]